MINNFSRCNDTPFFQLFYSTVQIKLLNETAINSNKLAQDTVSFLHYNKNANQIKRDSQIYVLNTVITANQLKKWFATYHAYSCKSLFSLYFQSCMCTCTYPHVRLYIHSLTYSYALIYIHNTYTLTYTRTCTRKHFHTSIYDTHKRLVIYTFTSRVNVL